MRANYALFVVLVACGMMLSACGSKQKKKSTPATTVSVEEDEAPVAPVATTAPAKTEVATGELRDTILKLRRVHFAFDTATLTEDSRLILKEVGETLVKFPAVHLYVQGHADSLGSSEYNIALGDRRAQAVADYLSALGVTRDRLHTISYGEEKPIEYGASEAARAKNRRVDFRLMRGDVRLVVEEGEPVDDEGQPLPAGQASP